jgi:hypothetical protein
MAGRPRPYWAPDSPDSAIAMENDETERREALVEIFYRTRLGTVEGIEFDLRHNLLDPAEWQVWDVIGTESFGGEGSYAYGRRSGLPFIWFPWYGNFSNDGLSKEVDTCIKESNEYRKTVKDKNQPKVKSRSDYLKEFTPDAIVQTGDKIVIDFVSRHPAGDEFAHLHDAEFRFAYCKIIRANWKPVKIKKPILFVGVTSVIVKRADYNSFERISNRICDYFSVNRLADIHCDKGDFACTAAYYAHWVISESRDALKLMHSDHGYSPDYHKANHHWRSVNQAVLMGYFWARAEAEMNMKPLAISGLRVKAGGSSGGKTSGNKRRQKRTETWEPVAMQMAKAIRRDNPSASQDDVAAEIDAGWKDATCDPPGHSTLKGLISRMEHAGELPKRRRV